MDGETNDGHQETQAQQEAQADAREGLQQEAQDQRQVGNNPSPATKRELHPTVGVVKPAVMHVSRFCGESIPDKCLSGVQFDERYGEEESVTRVRAAEMGTDDASRDRASGQNRLHR